MVRVRVAGRMRIALFSVVAACGLIAAPVADAAPKAKTKVVDASPKPWCAPEVSELSDRTCWFDGGVPADGRRTLVVYLHGAYAATPGFQHLQQKALALMAQKHNFTLLLPTAPKSAGGYVWPGGAEAQKNEEQAILANILASKKELEARAGKKFDETFIAGFSSGAYYGSSLALRSAIDVDGFMFFAGGSGWVKPAIGGKRAPVFVAVSAADKQTASHSRALGGTLAALGWPRRVEERDVGHAVDWGFMQRAITYLRSQSPYKAPIKTASNGE
jgi:predicted esterase